MIGLKKIRKPPRGILLLAHGSPEPGVAAEAESLRRRLVRISVEPALYSLAWLNRRPDLAGGVETLASKGCRTIQILPLLLFRGKHLKRDLPQMVARARKRHPKLKLILGGALSGLPGFVPWLAVNSRTPKRRPR